jgi:DNA-binding CsgD family transcriptional regulator
VKYPHGLQKLQGANLISAKRRGILIWGFRKKKKAEKTEAIRIPESEKGAPSPGGDATVIGQGRTRGKYASEVQEACPLPDLLTKREREVFELLIQGKTMKAIGEKLDIEYSTVNTHQKNIYKKLNLHSRAECILRYGIPSNGKED